MGKNKSEKVEFSICIPNYNYEAFLRQTLESVQAQSFCNWQMCLADNCSDDSSVQIVKSFKEQRFSYKINHCNVGFARNLDQAAQMADGAYKILLSSDDLMHTDALQTYAKIQKELGTKAPRTILTSAMEVIDPEGEIKERIEANANVWYEEDVDIRLSKLLGCKVYRVKAADLLKRSLLNMLNPFNFAATCYSDELYQAVEGYGGARLINPDKWFHWRILAEAEEAIFVERPLFSYRWHPNNQTALQKQSGALKFLVDDYASVIEFPNTVLQQLGMEKKDLEKAFIEQDIAKHGLATLGRGDAALARRIYDFGKAVYPKFCKNNLKAKALKYLLQLGPIGQEIGVRAYAYKFPESRGFRVL